MSWIEGCSAPAGCQAAIDSIKTRCQALRVVAASEAAALPDERLQDSIDSGTMPPNEPILEMAVCILDVLVSVSVLSSRNVRHQ